MPKKKIPKFKSNKEAADFLSTHDSTDYVDDLRDLDEPIELDPALKKRIKARAKKRLLTIRLEQKQIDDAKRIAEERSIPYQILMRSWIAEGIKKEKKSLEL